LTWDKARLGHPDRAFDAKFGGQVYAQPLYWRSAGPEAGILIVATEDDSVLAIDAATGKIIWQKSLGTPVSRDALPCGNIDPVGITGTPIIDPGNQIIYLDAAVRSPSGPRHKVFALSLRDGSTIAGWPVDVAEALRAVGQRFDPATQGERGALTILGNRVYVPFGGNYGDCGAYHGWVVGISIDDPTDVKGWRTRAHAGGIWAPGGISSDGKSLFVATGNTIDAAQWGDGEAIIRLVPDLGHSLREEDYFAPSNWHELDDGDADLGGTGPLPFDIGSGNTAEARIIALGKDGRAYVLDRNHLGGIGGELAASTVSTGRIVTAPAAYSVAGSDLIAFGGDGSDCPDESGDLTVLKIGAGARPRISTAWCGSVRGSGAPIVTTTDGQAYPIVWILGAEGDDRLHGFRGDTGEPLFRSERLRGLRHFQTLIAAHGHLYVAADGRVFAFAL
jgi:outer membrane protein assembly factor BamB